MKLKVIKILRDVIYKIIRNWVIIIVLSKCNAVDVVWDLVSRPVIFGGTATLMCNISDTNNNCNGRLYQWLGGINYGWLCSDTSCDNKKYEAMKQSNCSYILNIHDFSESDVNRDYACLYGVSNRRKTLVLNQENFLYIPSLDDIQVKSDMHMNYFGIMANISKIFPAPTCFTTILDEDVNKTERIVVKTTIGSLLYTTEMSINYSLPACSDLSFYCFIAEKHKINIFEKSTDCQGYKNMSTIMISLIVIVVFTTTGVIFLICFKLRKRQTATDETVCAQQRESLELRQADMPTEPAVDSKLLGGYTNEEQRGHLRNSTAVLQIEESPT